MMGNKGRKENSGKYNREMKRAEKEERGTKKRKKQKNKKVGKKKKTEQTGIEGRIEAKTKRPKAQYIHDTQVDIDGKQVNQVIGKHRYKNSTFGIKDLRYFMERGYIRIKKEEGKRGKEEEDSEEEEEGEGTETEEGAKGEEEEEEQSAAGETTTQQETTTQNRHRVERHIKN